MDTYFFPDTPEYVLSVNGITYRKFSDISQALLTFEKVKQLQGTMTATLSETLATYQRTYLTD